MYRFLIIGMIIMAVMGIYFYFFLNRAARFWLRHSLNLPIILLIAIVSAVLTYECRNPFGTPALVLYHVLGISLAMEVVNSLFFLEGKKKHKEYFLWQRIFQSGMIPVLATALILGFGHLNMLNVKMKTYDLQTQKQLQSAEGYSIAFISDLHFGTTMKADKLQKYCDEISALSPDLVVLGGDIVDDRTTSDEMVRSLQILGNIESRYGIFYVYGNHDSAIYPEYADFTAEELYQNLMENDIRVLADEVCEIGDDILLVGRKDRYYNRIASRKSVVELLEGEDMNRYVILADHQPVELQQNASAGVDLQLSGHTHGGQIWPVGLMIEWLGFGEMNYGEREIGNYHIIVSSGMAGWGYAVRTGHGSEYVLVHVE